MPTISTIGLEDLHKESVPEQEIHINRSSLRSQPLHHRHAAATKLPSSESSPVNGARGGEDNTLSIPRIYMI
ncbi:unnamed protein product [Lactuca virosa]|uniref:Uncharacterized protein n=1 Tax=Lactuca virosa TaxID=75947 RepID=A0AAU9NDV9_9ASTR|nr:unnamed protein product [Lactuca virosa]